MYRRRSPDRPTVPDHVASARASAWWLCGRQRPIRGSGSRPRPPGRAAGQAAALATDPLLVGPASAWHRRAHPRRQLACPTALVDPFNTSRDGRHVLVPRSGRSRDHAPRRPRSQNYGAEPTGLTLRRPAVVNSQGLRRRRPPHLPGPWSARPRRVLTWSSFLPIHLIPLLRSSVSMATSVGSLPQCGSAPARELVGGPVRQAP